MGIPSNQRDTPNNPRGTPSNRRQFLQTSAAGAAYGLGGLAFLQNLPRVSADEVKPDTKVMRLTGDIEPMVRLLEETPREKLLEQVADRIHHGTTYREVLAALLLAGVRNIQPRPVGFKFHAVLVVNSAHLASISSPQEHRWLPIFWALDFFKDSQAKDIRESNWRMSPVNESAVPKGDAAHKALADALDNWDEGAADTAVAGLARTAGMHEIYELLFRYGCRDFRDIGHKAIYVANSMRTLECIGWQNAEAVLRSVVYALVAHEGDNPAHRDAEADRPGRRNRELLAKIRPQWTSGKLDDAATHSLLATLRDGTGDAACDQVVELLNGGIGPQSIWNALHCGAGELLSRQPGIVGIHAVTSTNALHYAFQVSADDATRRLLLLQNAAFLPMFRAAMKQRGKLADKPIDKLEPAATKASGADALQEIFADVGRDRDAAAQKILAYTQTHPEPKELIDMARLLVFSKGNDAHDYKFSSALLEDYRNLSGGWRERYLASGAYNLRGSGTADNKLVERTRAALEG